MKNVQVEVVDIKVTKKGNKYAKISFTTKRAGALAGILSDNKKSGWSWANADTKVGDKAEITDEEFNAIEFKEESNAKGKFYTF